MLAADSTLKSRKVIIITLTITKIGINLFSNAIQKRLTF